MATMKDERWSCGEQGATCCHAAKTLRRLDKATANPYKEADVFPRPALRDGCSEALLLTIQLHDGRPDPHPEI